jgi:hypothetical protein
LAVRGSGAETLTGQTATTTIHYTVLATPIPAPPTGTAPPVAVASVSATAKPGVIRLTARHSSAAPGQRITAYAWYLGSTLIGRPRRCSTASPQLTPTRR